MAIVDELSEADKAAYKVGESLLILSNAMLRSVGDLDNEISLSFDKRGLWFMYGYEGKDPFDGVTEWAEYTPLPETWKKKIFGGVFGRAMFQNAQIVRPEVEAVLRERMAEQPLITVIDSGRVVDVVVASNVLHTTRRMDVTLDQCRALLKPGGIVVVNELTQRLDYNTLTFGLTEGWWLYEDEETRISGSPLLCPQQWRASLAAAGFDDTEFHGLAGVADDDQAQCVIVARAV